MNRSALMLGIGLAAALLLASLAWVGDLGTRTPILLGIWGAAHALYLAASWLATRARSRPVGASARTLVLILSVGLIPRLALLPSAPVLSEDLYRYLWDGRLVANGVNPYSHAPSDSSLAGLRGDLLDRLNHPDVPTVYPPAAQLLFGAAASIDPAPAVWKGLLLLLEGLLVAALARLLARRGAPIERLLLYYWNPLVIVECYGDGHVDLAAAAFLVLALALLEARRALAAGVALGIAIGTKLVPAVLLLPLVRRRAWATIATAGVALVLLVLPFAGAGGALADGLRIYARHWEFNGPLYALARQAFPNGDGPRIALAVLFGIAAIAIARRARTPSGATFALLIAFLLTSPTVYPWYLVPAIALLPLHPDPGLLAFSGLVALCYLPLESYRATGAWSVPPSILAIEYGGMLAAWGAAWALRGRRAPEPARAAA